MKYPTYETIVAERYGHFDFTSIGRKGKVKKRIIFRQTSDKELVLLALVDVRKDGTFDDQVVTDNGDRDKILATVAKAILFYTDKFPDKWIAFEGSTDARTRLYRVAIALHIVELSKHFIVRGALLNHTKTHPFSVGVPYVAFFIKKKIE
jgi:hypothetical protein